MHLDASSRLTKYGEAKAKMCQVRGGVIERGPQAECAEAAASLQQRFPHLSTDEASGSAVSRFAIIMCTVRRFGLFLVLTKELQ